MERIGLEPAPMGADYEEAIESAEVWVAMADDDVAGYAVTRYPGDDGVLLENLAVAPDHQGRGIGRALIAHVETRAMARGAAHVELFTHEAMNRVMAQVTLRTLRRAARREELWNGNREGWGGLRLWDPSDSVIRWAWDSYAADVDHVFDAYMSPGSVTERLHFFAAAYTPASRTGDGGGVAEEGEDIEVLELDFAEALAMTRDGRIKDGKTVMLLQWAALDGPFARARSRQAYA